MTANVYMDIGKLFLKQNKEEALANFEQAYLIY